MSNEHLLWLIFGVVLAIAMTVDLGMKSHRHRTEPVPLGEALRWTAIWATLALGFGGVVWVLLSPQRAFEYLTAYLVEESLSVDNMFVFVMIFDFFKIPAQFQPRILKWGIFGAIVMRFILIFTGVALLSRFHWILYVFGALLIFTAIKMVSSGGGEVDVKNNWLLKFAGRFLRLSPNFDGENFFSKEQGKHVATPLFTTLLVVEASDVMFAMDSIPAVLAISDHPFIIFSSNVFAVLGLRALFFLVSGVMGLFKYLRFGLAAILVFIGAKMLLSHFIKVPVLVSLSVVGVCLAVSILASVLVRSREGPQT